jgi:hypothetical protein
MRIPLRCGWPSPHLRETRTCPIDGEPPEGDPLRVPLMGSVLKREELTDSTPMSTAEHVGARKGANVPRIHSFMVPILGMKWDWHKEAYVKYDTTEQMSGRLPLTWENNDKERKNNHALMKELDWWWDWSHLEGRWNKQPSPLHVPFMYFKWSWSSQN